MKRALAVAAVLVALSPSAFAQPKSSLGAATNQSTAATAALLQVDRDWAKTAAEKSIEHFMNFVAEDVRSYSDGVMQAGKEAFREPWMKFFADPNFGGTWLPERAEVAESGDLGWTTGTFDFRTRLPDGAPLVLQGTYVTVWRKSAGAWKVAADIGSFLPAKPAPQADAGSKR